MEGPNRRPTHQAADPAWAAPGTNLVLWAVASLLEAAAARAPSGDFVGIAVAPGAEELLTRSRRCSLEAADGRAGVLVVAGAAVEGACSRDRPRNWAVVVVVRRERVVEEAVGG